MFALRTCWIKMFDIRCSIWCSVICISLNLFKNVRAVEMFVWLLGLVVRLSVCWLRGRLLRISFSTFFYPRAPSIKRENVVLPSYFHFDISTACGAGESNTQSINLSSLLFMIPFSQIILEHGTYYNTFKCQAFILIQGIKTPKLYWDVGALSGVNLNIKENAYSWITWNFSALFDHHRHYCRQGYMMFLVL